MMPWFIESCNEANYICKCLKKVVDPEVLPVIQELSTEIFNSTDQVTEDFISQRVDASLRKVKAENEAIAALFLTNLFCNHPRCSEFMKSKEINEEDLIKDYGTKKMPLPATGIATVATAAAAAAVVALPVATMATSYCDCRWRCNYNCYGPSF